MIYIEYFSLISCIIKSFSSEVEALVNLIFSSLTKAIIALILHMLFSSLISWIRVLKSVVVLFRFRFGLGVLLWCCEVVVWVVLVKLVFGVLMVFVCVRFDFKLVA